MTIKRNKWLLGILFATVLFGCQPNKKTNTKEKPLNILLLTLDDMGYGTTGVEGCNVPGITPNIDKLASEGMLITHGYVMTPICGPSRAAILSGRYPHNNGIMGHGQQPPALWQQPDIVTPYISKYLHDAGYMTGALLKNRRSRQFNTWDVMYNELPYGVGFHDRNPDSFYKRTKEFIEGAKKSNKPFILYASPIDPHRPWVDTHQEKNMLAEWNPERSYPEPSRRYTAEEVEVPAFLPDLPGIRKNLISYYESLHRGDECIGGILKALEESGVEDNTLVIFLSDHGMGAIGAKASLYQDGVRTPVIVKWPGKIKKGKVDDASIVSSIDIVPTIIDAIGLPKLEALEGKSFFNLVTSKSGKSGRSYAYTASNYFNKSNVEEFFPQRSIIDTKYCYIWNSYVVRFDGKKRFHEHWKDVVLSSLKNGHSRLEKKLEQMTNKSIEEFYDLSKDPGCWDNLAQDPEYAEKIKEYREKLYKEMKETADPELSVFNLK